MFFFFICSSSTQTHNNSLLTLLISICFTFPPTKKLIYLSYKTFFNDLILFFVASTFCHIQLMRSSTELLTKTNVKRSILEQQIRTKRHQAPHIRASDLQIVRGDGNKDGILAYNGNYIFNYSILMLVLFSLSLTFAQCCMNK
jgi:hypothetical protein